jgi:hypothetical protein
LSSKNDCRSLLSLRLQLVMAAAALPISKPYIAQQYAYPSSALPSISWSFSRLSYDFMVMVELELVWRKIATDVGCSEVSMLQPPPHLQLPPEGDSRQCTACKWDCYLSMVMCSCSRANGKVVCSRHAALLCGCNQRVLLTRCAIDRLRQLLEKLQHEATVTLAPAASVPIEPVFVDSAPRITVAVCAARLLSAQISLLVLLGAGSCFPSPGSPSAGSLSQGTPPGRARFVQAPTRQSGR